MLKNERVSSRNVLKVRVDKIRFPQFCPVCFEPATEITTVIQSEKTFLEASPYRSMLVNAGHYGRYREYSYTPGMGSKNTIRVPTCELHKFEGLKGIRKVYWFSFTLISFAPILFLFYSTTNAFFMGRDVLPSLVGFLLMISIVALTTLYIFWPRPFQQYFKILDIIPNDIDILLELKNPEYQDAFIEMNGMHVTMIDETELEHLREKQ